MTKTKDLNQELRALLRSGTAKEKDVRKLADDIIASGQRLNPTGTEFLPPGNVAYGSFTGRFEQKRPEAAKALQRIGAGRIIIFTDDLIWIAFGKKPKLVTKKAKAGAPSPETDPAGEAGGDTLPLDPGSFHVIDLTTHLENIDDPDECEAMIEMELNGLNRDTAVQAIKQRRDAILAKGS